MNNRNVKEQLKNGRKHLNAAEFEFLKYFSFTTSVYKEFLGRYFCEVRPRQVEDLR